MLLTEKEFLSFDMTALASLIRKGEITETELLGTVKQRIEKINPAINAVVASFDDDPDMRTGTGKGPFEGVPFFIKDLYAHVANQPTTGACVALRDNVVDHDTEIVKRYREAGLRIVGRSNTCEFGTLGTCEPLMHGPTRNPWSLEHSSGGSSGGAGALVAAGIIPAAHGGDGAGSIRIPASCCGVFGLKPTRGRNSLGPDLGEGLSGIVSEHVLTRTVRDSAALLDSTSGTAIGDPYSAHPPIESFLTASQRHPGKLRIGMMTQSLLGITAHPDCASATMEAAKLLQSLGHEVVETQFHIDIVDFRDRYCRLWALAGTRGILSAAVAVGKNPDEVADQAEVFNQYLYERGTGISAAQYLQDHAWFHCVSRKICAFESQFDLMLTPTLGTPPPVLGHFDGRNWSGDQIMERFFEFLGFTLIANLTGQPSVSIPLSWNRKNLPIGIQLTAKTGEEGLLLSVAYQIEQAQPWNDRRPTL